jgi:hypothetical protein
VLAEREARCAKLPSWQRDRVFEGAGGYAEEMADGLQ